MTFPFRLIYSQEPQGRVIPEVRSGTHLHSGAKFTYISLEYSLVYICVKGKGASLQCCYHSNSTSHPATMQMMQSFRELCRTELFSPKREGKCDGTSPGKQTPLSRGSMTPSLPPALSSCCLSGMHNTDFGSAASRVILMDP